VCDDGHPADQQVADGALFPCVHDGFETPQLYACRSSLPQPDTDDTYADASKTMKTSALPFFP
jgi:hypothetical protein